MVARLTYSLAVMLCVIGCGKTEVSNLPPAHPVTGVVTLDDKPIEGAVLQFVPIGETRGNDCYGTTDAAGRYSIAQLRGSEGAQVGEYAVVIEYHLLPDGRPMPKGEMPRAVGATQVLPPKYSDPASTTLRATVSEGGGEVNFQLKSK